MIAITRPCHDVVTHHRAIYQLTISEREHIKTAEGVETITERGRASARRLSSYNFIDSIPSRESRDASELHKRVHALLTENYIVERA